MRTSKYIRGEYNIRVRKNNPIKFFVTELDLQQLKLLSVRYDKNQSQIIRDALTEYYIKHLNEGQK